MLKSKRNIRNVGCAILLVCILCLLGAGSVFAQGNIQDSGYWLNYYGDGGDLATEHRAKLDYTSSYTYHKGTVAGLFSVRYRGTNYTYGRYAYRVGTWQSAYLPNLIRENGLGSCQLWITPETHSATTIYGQWSPDSV